jgi:hypothetical protein
MAHQPGQCGSGDDHARPVDSAIVDERAPCSVKCSVVTNVTVAERGSLSA